MDPLASEGYRAGQRERYKVERMYGEGKAYHGLRRCRCVGRMRYLIQAYPTAIGLNLTQMVRVVTGTSSKGRARAAVPSLRDVRLVAEMGAQIDQ